MRRLLLATIVLLGAARFLAAQGNAPGTAGAPSPDCYQSGIVSAAGRYSIFYNGNSGCLFWHLTFNVANASAVSIEVDQAPLGLTPLSVGSWSAMTAGGGTTNPSTSTTFGEMSLLGDPANVSVNLATLTPSSGTAYVAYQLMGFRPNSTNSSVGFGQQVFAGVSSGNPASVIACDQSTAVAVTAGNTTKILTKATGKNIYICGALLSIATTGTVEITSGTHVSADCDTSTATLTGPMNLAAGSVIPMGAGFGQVMKTASTGLDVCIAAVTGNVRGVLSWTQF